MDFAGLRLMIESWEAVIPDLGRPSRIRVILGNNYFDCVITHSSLSFASSSAISTCGRH